MCKWNGHVSLTPTYDALRAIS